MDRATVKRIRDVLQTALESLDVEPEIGQKIGFRVGNASFTDSVVTFKVEAATFGENGEKNSKAAEDFKRCAFLWGLSPDDLGKQAEVNGKLVTIVGCKPRSKKYPILARDEKNGKTYKFSATSVKLGLKDRPFNERFPSATKPTSPPAVGQPKSSGNGKKTNGKPWQASYHLGRMNKSKRFSSLKEAKAWIMDLDSVCGHDIKRVAPGHYEGGPDLALCEIRKV